MNIKTVSKLLIICICIGSAGTMFPSLNKISTEEHYYIEDLETVDILDSTGGDSIQYTEDPMDEDMIIKSEDLPTVPPEPEPEGVGFAEVMDFDYKNAIIGGIFGYLLTNGLDLMKKLFVVIASFFRRKKE